MECPTCRGARQIINLFGYSVNRPGELPCHDCNGTGQVDDRFPEWLKQGQKLKDGRIARRETLLNFCRRTGVDYSLRSRQERGLSDPSKAMR